jgi:surfeit locus 1 family protein
MKPGPRVLILVAIIAAAIFARLGFWQLSRLSERRALNAELAARAVAPAVPLSGLPTDTANAHYRRVRLEGAYDYTREIVLTLRSREGSPGVNIVTPLRLLGSDSSVLVVRGWVYSADGETVNLAKWREGDSANGNGFVETYPPPRGGPNASPSHPNTYRWLDRAELERRLGYPLEPYYVVLTSAPDDSSGATIDAAGAHGPAPDSTTSGSRKSIPPRLTVPPMDEGPHQSYAIQWFSFAAISIIGMTLFLRRKND